MTQSRHINAPRFRWTPEREQMLRKLYPDMPAQLVAQALQLLDKVCDEAAREQPEPPPEAQTKAEQIAYCAGWWAAMAAKAKQRMRPDLPETDCGNIEPAAWIDNTGHPKHRLYRQSATEKRLYGPLRPLYAARPTTTTQPEPK
jgi:hypothetical protein